MDLWLRYDLRSPSFAKSTAELASAALDQVAWADRQGFDTIQLGEHHGTEDGYNPSPLMFAAAVAARTSRVRIHPVLILPLHDPVRLAEDICVLDNITGGRLDITIGSGYVPSEFEMFGVSFRDRGHITDAKLQVLRDIFDGRPFDYEGRRGRVTPLPFQPGGPKLFIGGSVMATARRAARYGDGYYPMDQSPRFVDEYRRACDELGKKPGKIVGVCPTRHIHVTHDPDRAWSQIAPHALHETNSYARAAQETGQMTMFRVAEDANVLRQSGAYLMLTPDQCIEHCRAEIRAGNPIVIPPLLGGLDPSITWESLDLLASDVLPVLRSDEKLNAEAGIASAA